MDHDGGCVCRQVRYRVAGSPIIVHACHCTRCQTLTGSAFAVNAMIEADRVTLLRGASREHELEGGHVWARCPTCHVGVWSRHPSSARRSP